MESSAFPSKIKINLMQLKTYKLLKISNNTKNCTNNDFICRRQNVQNLHFFQKYDRNTHFFRKQVRNLCSYMLFENRTENFEHFVNGR